MQLYKIFLVEKFYLMLINYKIKYIELKNTILNKKYF